MPKAEQSLNDLLHEIRRIEQSREVLTEKKIRKIYKQLLKELNHFLADEYLKYSKDGILTVAMLQEKSRYAKFLEEIESHVNNLTPEIVALIKNTVEDTYTACYKGMSESVLKAKDTKSALNYLKDLNIRPEVMKRAIENPVSGLTLPDILEKNRKEVIYDIKQQVNIGLMNGDRYETTAKKVAERLDISYGKATNIVRTETHRVTESGFMDCAKDISDSLDGSGLVYTAAWRTMKDERVRPQHRYRTKSGWKTSISRNGANHQKMEGVIIQVGDKFQLEPNVYAECPSTSGTARNDCRCRCFLEYTLMSVEKFEELTGKSVDKSGGSGIIKLKDCNNFSHIENYLSKTYNIELDNSVKKLNFETCKSVLQGAVTLISEYPELGRNLQKVTTSKYGVMCCTGKEICFNSKYFKSSDNLSEMCKSQSTSGFWAKNSSPASIGVHETAHAIEQLLIDLNSSYDYDWQKTLAWNDCTEAKIIVSQAIKDVKKTAYGKGKTKEELVNAISRYACKTLSETMAEAFADVYANGDNANPLSLIIKKLTHSQYLKYKKGGN